MGKGMSKILPGLYVGCYADYADEEELKKHEITHIVSACVMENEAPPPSNISRITVNVDDRPSESISPHFKRCIDFIHKARGEGGNVLVHCMAGVSRSVTITAAYLLTISDIDWRQALSCIKASRSVANPNYGFQVQLQEWCETERPMCQELLRRRPAVPHPDKEILDQLQEKYEKWVLTGDHEEDEQLYPLAPGAYKSASTTGETSAVSATKESKGDRRRRAMRECLRRVIRKERAYDTKTEELKQKNAAQQDKKESELYAKLSSQCSLGASNLTQSFQDKSLPNSENVALRSDYSTLRDHKTSTANTQPTFPNTDSSTDSQVSNYQYVQSAEQLKEPFRPPPT